MGSRLVFFPGRGLILEPNKERTWPIPLSGTRDKKKDFFYNYPFYYTTLT